jgi:hypothetical protein
MVLGTRSTEPEAVVYAMHDHTARFSRSLRCAAGATDGLRPKVWVTSGSHASYPRSCDVPERPSCQHLMADLPRRRAK